MQDFVSGCPSKLASYQERELWYEEWNTIMSTDESRFEIFNDKWSVWTWKPPTRRINPPCVQKVRTYHNGMKWYFAIDITDNIVEYYLWNLEPKFGFLTNSKLHRTWSCPQSFRKCPNWVFVLTQLHNIKKIISFYMWE